MRGIFKSLTWRGPHGSDMHPQAQTTISFKDTRSPARGLIDQIFQESEGVSLSITLPPITTFRVTPPLHYNVVYRRGGWGFHAKVGAYAFDNIVDNDL